MSTAMAALVGRDENVQVNGYVFVIEMSGFSAKHMTHWTMDDMRNWNNCWQVRSLCPRP